MVVAGTALDIELDYPYICRNKNYKGITIRIINNVLGPGKDVLGKFIVKGKTHEVKGDTKEYVVAVSKDIIRKILG